MAHRWEAEKHCTAGHGALPSPDRARQSLPRLQPSSRGRSRAHRLIHPGRHEYPAHGRSSRHEHLTKEAAAVGDQPPMRSKTILDGGRSPSVLPPCTSEWELGRPGWRKAERDLERRWGEESGVRSERRQRSGVERLGPTPGGHAAVGSPEPPEPNGVGTS